MDPQIKKLFGDKSTAEGAARFGLHTEELSFIGGFQNFIFSYTREGCKYIFRFTPSTLRSPAGLAAELEWIRYLAANGMSVSEPIPSANELDVESIPGETISFYATSFKHAPGHKIGYPECLDNPFCVMSPDSPCNWSVLRIRTREQFAVGKPLLVLFSC
ncbi:hypothetical protein [Paenibacillus sp. MBLB4367]|uniref:hypothetical protein n=1 Tax=Paenibacillus sp. MBLB4367 TaxID=3384767 RepID=UPI003908146B